MPDNFHQVSEFIEPSPKMLSKSLWLSKYQSMFDNCPIGKSFKIDKIDVKLSTLRPVVSRINKDHNKKFKVVDHEHCYEIGRRK